MNGGPASWRAFSRASLAIEGDERRPVGVEQAAVMLAASHRAPASAVAVEAGFGQPGPAAAARGPSAPATAARRGRAACRGVQRCRRFGTSSRKPPPCAKPLRPRPGGDIGWQERDQGLGIGAAGPVDGLGRLRSDGAVAAHPAAGNGGDLAHTRRWDEVPRKAGLAKVGPAWRTVRGRLAGVRWRFPGGPR